MDVEKIVLLVIGAIVGFILSITKDFLLENKKKKLKQDDLYREKLEELYLLVDNWSKIFTTQGLHLLAVMNGKIDYNEYLDLIIEAGEKREYNFSRLEMILNIYASELDSAYRNILDERDKLNKIHNAYKKEYEENNMYTKKFIKPYTKSLFRMQDYLDNLNKKLVKKIQNI